MAESEGIQDIVKQAAVQAVKAVVMALREADAGTQLANTAVPRESQRKRHDRLALEKPLFNWNAQDRYVDILNFEVKVKNILEIKAYKLSEEEKVPTIKN